MNHCLLCSALQVAVPLSGIEIQLLGIVLIMRLYQHFCISLEMRLKLPVLGKKNYKNNDQN